MNNVFEGVGQCVVDEAFFGYHEECDRLVGKLTSGKLYRCDYRGLNKVGKTSLMLNVARLVEDYYADDNDTVVVCMDMSPFTSSDKFWREMSKAWRRALSKKGLLTGSLEEYLEPEEFAEETHSITTELQDQAIRVIMFIDEFDQAIEILAESDFQKLRLFAQSPVNKGGVSLILFHRLSLQYIERRIKIGRVSTLSGVINDKLILSGFHEHDMELYWAQFDHRLTDMQKAEIQYYCANQPYGLGMFGNEIMERIKQGEVIEKIDISQVFQSISANMYDWYNHRIIKLLEEEKMIDDMIEFIIAGRDASLDKNLGLLSDEVKFAGFWQKGNSYAISEFFTSILRIYYKSHRSVQRSDLELLEDKMRDIMLIEMRNLPKDVDVEPSTLWHVYRFNKDRREALHKNKRYQKMIDDNGSFWGCEYQLEDVLSFADIYDIFRVPENWDILCHHLPREKREFSVWEDKLWCCVMARNALSHGSRETIPMEKRGHVRDYCHELINMFSDNRIS